MHAGGIIFTEYGLRFAKEGDQWRCVEWPDLVTLRGDCHQLNDATLATGSLSLKGVGIVYILRCRTAVSGLLRPRKCLTQRASSPAGANLACS